MVGCDYQSPVTNAASAFRTAHWVMRGINALWHPIRLPLNGFTYFSLSFQSAFQLSLTVLVCYRTRIYI